VRLDEVAFLDVVCQCRALDRLAFAGLRLAEFPDSGGEQERLHVGGGHRQQACSLARKTGAARLRPEFESHFESHGWSIVLQDSQ